MTATFAIIIVEGIDNTQRTLIHELVKNDAEDWWHDLPNVWIVKGGGSVNEWRDRLRPIVPLAPSTFAVLALKSQPRSRWATRGGLSSIGSWYSKATKEPPSEPP